MGEPLKVTGMVLSAAPSSEYDKRMVILTKERGRITAFARGARRQNSPLLAASNPFVSGSFLVYEGRTAYTLTGAEVSNYFMEIREDYMAACYGCYFMEVAEYYTRENLDGTAMLNLLYATLRALSNEKLDNELIRCVFEMKAMVINGEYPYDVVHDTSLLESTRYALAYVIRTPVQKLYTFTLSPEVFAECRHLQDYYNRMQIDRKFKSLEILKTMADL
ncbi:MAG: DNA repair protein RecO [Candidatus Choladocola sp.]|nr:DNA repair protein RecO [Candidatus Choladocola sp.]